VGTETDKLSFRGEGGTGKSNGGDNGQKGNFRFHNFKF
jgi:hypothetical protein